MTRTEGSHPLLTETAPAVASKILEQAGRNPLVALVLGSGLGDFAEGFANPTAFSTTDLPGYPRGSVQGHKGRVLIVSPAADQHALLLQGRLHFYESHDVDVVLFPIHVCHHLGVRSIVLTNAAGGVSRGLSPGDLMLITDQVNLTTESPRTSGGDGPVFDPGLAGAALRTAEALGIPLRQGVYVGVKGPSYETAAEVAMVHRIGGDAVGMSTVLETEEAHALGMRVLGISCITNKATGIGAEKLSHDEVTEVATRVRARFERLLSALLHDLLAAA